MLYSTGIVTIREMLTRPLPGEAAQLLMAPRNRKRRAEYLAASPGPRLSSVLLLLYPDAQGMLHTVFIERPSNDSVHSGQIALPGGKMDPSDLTLAVTALRETEEEIGIDRTNVELIGALSPLYIPASNFLVHPHVGITEFTPAFNPNPNEVHSVIPVPVDLLLTLPKEIKQVRTAFGYLEAPYFPLEGRTMWGATAMMVSEFREMIGSGLMK